MPQRHCIFGIRFCTGSDCHSIFIRSRYTRLIADSDCAGCLIKNRSLRADGNNIFILCIGRYLYFIANADGVFSVYRRIFSAGSHADSADALCRAAADSQGILSVRMRISIFTHTGAEITHTQLAIFLCVYPQMNLPCILSAYSFIKRIFKFF